MGVVSMSIRWVWYQYQYDTARIDQAQYDDDDTTVILLATYVEVSVGLRMGFISGSNPGGGGI